MSWTENKKLNEWIERAYENGKREEQERIKKQLDVYGNYPLEAKLDDWLKRALNAESNDSLAKGHDWGAQDERYRIIKLLTDLNVLRRCAATNKLVAFDTNGENVIYLTGLETDV